MDPIIETTRAWIENLVIGLNLCPFAQRVFRGEKIRYVVSQAPDAVALTDNLRDELLLLARTPIEDIETTLLIHPLVLGEFLDYNDFLDAGNQLIARLNLDGVIQIASFHPAYQFAGTEPDDAENFTNRSPYPLLHLLREESITGTGWSEEEMATIPERNIDTMRRLGRDEIRRRQAGESP